MTRAKAEKIKRGIDNKIRKTTVDMEWWAYFWGFTVDEYEEFLDMAIEALTKEPEEDCVSRKWVMSLYEEWKPMLATNVDGFGYALKHVPSVVPKGSDTK